MALIDSYTSWGKASGGGGTIIGSPDVKAYNPPPSLPSSMATTTSQTRSFPERIDVNAIGGQATGNEAFNLFATLGSVPGRTLELPFSLTNQLMKGNSDKGPIDRLSEVLSPEGGIPFLNLIGHAGRAVNEALRVSGTIPAAIVNSGSVDALKNSAGLPDSADAGGGWLFGRPMKTVGELKADMRTRGFTDEDFADIQTGRKSLFDYGDRQASADPLSD